MNFRNAIHSLSFNKYNDKYIIVIVTVSKDDSENLIHELTGYYSEIKISNLKDKIKADLKIYDFDTTELSFELDFNSIDSEIFKKIRSQEINFVYPGFKHDALNIFILNNPINNSKIIYNYFELHG